MAKVRMLLGGVLVLLFVVGLLFEIASAFLMLGK